MALSEALRGAVDMAAEAFNRDGGLAGLSTGLKDLDQKLGGLHKSDLLIIAGRPSMGKSSLALNIAYHVAKTYAWEPQPDGARKTVDGGVVAFFSLEMSAEQLAMRLVAEVSGVPSDRLRKGEIEASEFGRVRDAAIDIQGAPLYIDDTGGLSIGRLAARARRLQRQVGLDLIVVDYLQLVTTGELSRNDNRVQEVTQITQGLKALAKELSVPVIACAQLSRQVEQRDDKRPQLSDLRESGSIEQDADVVMFVFRESYYLSRSEPREGTPEHLTWQEEMDKVAHLAEVIIGKQRHGPIGVVRMHYNDDLTKFSDLAREGSLRGALIRRGRGSAAGSRSTEVDRALQVVDADARALGIHDEAVADEDRVLAALRLIVELLLGHPPVHVGDPVVAGGGLVIGLDVECAGQAGQRAHRRRVGDRQRDTPIARRIGALGVRAGEPAGRAAGDAEVGPRQTGDRAAAAWP